MEKSKELNIEGIGLSQACIEFLQKRLASSDYRG